MTLAEKYKQKLEYMRQWRNAHPNYHKRWVKKNKNKKKLHNARASRKWLQNPANLAKKAEKTRLKNHGVTRGWFNDKLEEQKNCCAICSKPFKTPRDAHIDHDHQTEAIRDLLCSRCNTGLGYLEDLIFSSKGLEYLGKHKSINPLAPTER